jgi:hypothetical protein
MREVFALAPHPPFQSIPGRRLEQFQPFEHRPNLGLTFL